MTESESIALVRLLTILESSRCRKRMYFRPIDPSIVIAWLNGLRTGASLAGLEWNPDHRVPSLQRRGLELTASWEDERLAARGLDAEEIVDELLAIEIESWSLMRESGGDAAD